MPSQMWFFRLEQETSVADKGTQMRNCLGEHTPGSSDHAVSLVISKPLAPGMFMGALFSTLTCGHGCGLMTVHQGSYQSPYSLHGFQTENLSCAQIPFISPPPQFLVRSSPPILISLLSFLDKGTFRIPTFGLLCSQQKRCK